MADQGYRLLAEIPKTQKKKNSEKEEKKKRKVMPVF